MRKTAFISHPSSELHEMQDFHPESPARLVAIRNQLVADGLYEKLLPYEAVEATDVQLERVQSSEYLQQLNTASPSEGMTMLDPDTSMNPHSLTAARFAAGAGVLATELVVAGQVDNAFCSVRPPGHHAESGRAMGFCLFNNIAVAAAHALEALDLDRIAIVDFDVHHGNGTEQMFMDDPRVLFCSSFQHPFYPFSDPQSQRPYMVKTPLAQGSSAEDFRAAIIDFWLPALHAHRPQLILISAGFDAHRRDQMAGLSLTESEYLWVTREMLDVAQTHAGGRIVSMLEGGYELQALGKSVAAHIGGLLDIAD